MNDGSAQYKKGSLSLLGTVAMGTGVPARALRA